MYLNVGVGASQGRRAGTGVRPPVAVGAGRWEAQGTFCARGGSPQSSWRRTSGRSHQGRCRCTRRHHRGPWQQLGHSLQAVKGGQ